MWKGQNQKETWKELEQNQHKSQREEGAAHTRDTQDKVSAGAESSLHSEKNKPNGSSDFVVAALFTFVMCGLMLREIF